MRQGRPIFIVTLFLVTLKMIRRISFLVGNSMSWYLNFLHMVLSRTIQSDGLNCRLQKLPACSTPGIKSVQIGTVFSLFIKGKYFLLLFWLFNYYIFMKTYFCFLLNIGIYWASGNIRILHDSAIMDLDKGHNEDVSYLFTYNYENVC